ncbi:flagellar assembly protein FliH [Campylobacter sp.]|uniref:flagellar assembly protein FliH n=1 Tax=Campylobacter sp. TaxID=205 RepID=UPI002702BDCD|nr:flagellar assembly protein FliH [Campylobacter sp.]
MRSSVIANEDAKKHFVESYRFKVLGQEKRVEDNRTSDNAFVGQNLKYEKDIGSTDDVKIFDSNLAPANEVSEKLSQTPVSKDGLAQSNFVEELLKRIDELSGSIIKLQMQIENQESEFARRLENEVTRAEEEGLRQGEAKANAKFEEMLKELESRYSSSVARLDNESAKFERFLVSSEEELSNTAVDIAKEIVKKEISSSSSSVAYSLAKALMKDLSEAKDIQIRVSQKDFEFLKEQFGASDNIQVVPDEAINVGGVILMSDIGNLDGTIESRFEKIKKIISE